MKVRLILLLTVLALAGLSSSALAHHPVTTSGGYTAFFLDKDAAGTTHNTHRTAIQVDSAGGIHMTYTLITGDDPRPAVYAYCPANCGVPANWSKVALGHASGDFASIYWAQIELDRSVTPNRPRILLESITPAYSYAACNSNCTNPANWTITPIVTQNTGAVSDYSHNFTLDAQGRPHFVFYGHLTGAGTYYYTCATGCTSAASWTGTLLFHDFEPRHPTLAASPQGGIGLLDYFYEYNQETATGRYVLDYNFCISNCSNVSNWSYTYLGTIGSSYQWFRLRYDSQGRPRIALFPGSGLDSASSAFNQASLYYLWCNAGCTADGSNWSVKKILEQSNPSQPDNYLGSYPDLVLDAQNRPHMTASGNSSLLYVFCSAACESQAAGWTTKTVETASELNATHPVTPLDPNCQAYPTWGMGYYTSAGLLPDGAPVLAHTAQHLSFCTNWTVRTNLVWARVALGAVEYTVYLPLVTK